MSVICAECAAPVQRAVGEKAERYNIGYFCNGCKTLFDKDGVPFDTTQVYAVRQAVALESHFGVPVVIEPVVEVK
jgi:hypothetical protein